MPKRSLLILLVVFAQIDLLRAASPYEAGEHGQGRLQFINGLPVLIVQGKPEEMGEQIGVLTRKPLQKLHHFPQDYLRSFGYRGLWPILVRVSNSMKPSFPKHHLTELNAIIRSAGLDHDLAVAGNTFTDIKKIGACSTLIVEPKRTATASLLFGRNLDYRTLGYLHDYTLVMIYRPAGKHAFASIGFPGFIGCLSGINDAGLAVAVLEVYASKDKSLGFDPTGTPYAMCFRRVLEECTTIAEAKNLLQSMKRTTWVNLAVCDQQTGAVLEITPNNIVERRPEQGICPCTNHFRSSKLGDKHVRCRRYQALERSFAIDKITMEDMRQLLHDSRQECLTFQTMIFEPKTLTLHLAIGRPPTTARPLKRLELKPLLKP
ncbi:MAG: hypothetical protein KatS3mg105_1929 [Gemmatales bacterium]|nr:MAG: hypothetical protein KatS3mg105_1929 [Gemmatales bacterium]